MTALSTEIDCPVARAVDVTGVSNESWRDAVWNAIVPVSGLGRLAKLEVLHHALASRAGRAEYRVNVRVSFGPRERAESVRRHPAAELPRPSVLKSIP